MIEPTDEMRQAFQAAYVAAVEDDGLHFKEDGEIRLDAGVAAVLAIVERDYRIEPRPPWEKADRRHYDIACRDRPGCRVPEHHQGGYL